jgi:hypothetical protein
LLRNLPIHSKTPFYSKLPSCKKEHQRPRNRSTKEKPPKPNKVQELPYKRKPLKPKEKSPKLKEVQGTVLQKRKDVIPRRRLTKKESPVPSNVENPTEEV